MSKASRNRWMVAAGVAGSFGILAWLIAGNVGPLAAAASRLQWGWVLAAFAASAFAYISIGLALWEVLGLLGHSLSFAAVLGIAFVSTTANYFVSSVGVSGFALKAHLLRKRHVPYATTLTASVVSTAMLYFVLAVIIMQGLLYIWLGIKQRVAMLEGALGLGALLAVSVLLLKFFFDRELRGRMARTVFRWVNHATFYFSKNEIPRESFDKFLSQLNRGLDTIHHQRHRLTRAIGYTCLDWGFTMLVLYCGFRAVGVDLRVGPLSAGFAAGQAATLIPILPGGLGAMEGTMAALYKGLGVAWEDAMIAALIYRLAYYVVPGVLSVFLLWGLKVSEPTLIEETVKDTLPDELKLMAEDLERRRSEQ